MSADFSWDQYEAACKRATTSQGLDPLVRALKKAGYTVSVEQTGGFTMVGTIQAKNGVIAFNSESAAWYPADSWREGSLKEDWVTLIEAGEKQNYTLRPHAVVKSVDKFIAGESHE